jgi:hypothetical protein
MARVGKIAPLPLDTREGLNRRLARVGVPFALPVPIRFPSFVSEDHGGSHAYAPAPGGCRQNPPSQPESACVSSI